MSLRRRFPAAILAAALALSASGCIRFYFWAGENELAIPPEPEAEPTPEPAAPLRG